MQLEKSKEVMLVNLMGKHLDLLLGEHLETWWENLKEMMLVNLLEKH